MGKTPYDDRDDLEKLRSQWKKIDGILERRKEWSAAIVRAATAAEIAANIAIRKRFESESKFSSEFVDSLLRWANGIDGKFGRLIIPAERDEVRKKALGKLKKRSERLNKKRNAIVHQGAFASKREMRELVNLSREIVNELVIPWEPEFVLGGEKLTSSKVPKAKKVLKATNAKGRKKKS
ncbi:hypothetical protein AAG593_14835 [Citromicrobium bathyomarinum]|uniref:Apea-like HEPN domain-containing protein n=1 Tax=Qipengyuania pelagi TaxID=994320 RepID=A0A844YC86_9SPHN|nr:MULTISPECIES: hypothetical protein [Sphingomonadales]MAO95210.1 hypothetical protein [Citromicrobium sp.]MAY79139.1 hypothetical protein [Citromicrobium sp.]MXO54853.1 hypothetical protein [Qipengyuania pelagi]|tara:strand:- start:1745 stop:2284 length:540 start_codon:yes stop_codon:yes gene_type:complete